jgi:hypothetical protein
MDLLLVSETLFVSKNSSIRYETELVLEFKQLIASETDLKWHPVSEPGDGRWHGLELPWDGKLLRFALHYQVSPTSYEVEKLGRPIPSDQPSPRRLADTLPLLVVPKLTAPLLEQCRERHVSVIDLNGRAYLRAQGFLIDRKALPGRDFRFEAEPRNVFVGKSVRIVRSLLAQPDRTWEQRDLVERTRASAGLVSRIVTHLIRQNFLEKVSPREFRVRDGRTLLDAWAEADKFSRRVTTARYAAVSSDPVELAQRLKSLLAAHAQSVLFTQWIAGWLRRPYTEPVIVSAYVATLPDEAWLAELGLRPVNEGGRLWLHVPDDEGIFFETQTVRDLPLATDAQIYLDLLKTPLRGPEQAQALRDWDGFSRP